jgi:dihydropteroate synthase
MNTMARARTIDLGTTAIGRRRFAWGSRTFVMGILNATPDSFSGDGLLADTGDSAARALARGRAMVEAGADLLDVGGESTRPGHAAVATDQELGRVVPIVAALHVALPEIPLSVDTTKPVVAVAALDAGAALINDVWGVAANDDLVRIAAERGVPIVLMHNRAEARYVDVVTEVVDDLRQAIDRALGAGVAWASILIDPGFGFGKTPLHNLAVLRDLERLRALGRPILIGTSRKSTLGAILDLPVEDRVEATLATTAIAIAGGADVVRVHDVRANVRAARVADAIVRDNWRPSKEAGR